MKALMLAILLAVHLASVLGSPPLLSLQHKCWVSDASCLRSKVQAITPVLSKGNHALGIEQLDPMFLDVWNVDTKTLQFLFRNIHVKGLKDAVIDSVSIDMVSKVVQIVYHADLSVKSQYVGKGFLFGLPIFGEGDIAFNLANVQTEMNMPFDVIRDEYGRDVMNLKGFHYSHNVRGGAQYDLRNLYYGDKISSDKMHNLMHKNWKFLTVEYGRYLFDVMNPKIFKAIRNYMLSRALCDFVDL